MVWLAVNSPLSDNKHLLITEEQVVGVEVWGAGGLHMGVIYSSCWPQRRRTIYFKAPHTGPLLLNYSNYNLQPRRILLLLPLHTSDRRA